MATTAELARRFSKNSTAAAQLGQEPKALARGPDAVFRTSGGAPTPAGISLVRSLDPQEGRCLAYLDRHISWWRRGRPELHHRISQGRHTPIECPMLQIACLVLGKRAAVASANLTVLMGNTVLTTKLAKAVGPSFSDEASQRMRGDFANGGWQSRRRYRCKEVNVLQM